MPSLFSSFLFVEVNKVSYRDKEERNQIMKQVIRYLYEYENGNRIRNVGFIKLEKRMDKCAIHIHGKNLDFGQKKEIGGVL